MERPGAEWREIELERYGAGGFVLRATESFKLGSDRIRFALEKGCTDTLGLTGRCRAGDS